MFVHLALDVFLDSGRLHTETRHGTRPSRVKTGGVLGPAGVRHLNESGNAGR